jgi:16S rRNA (guanine527-N7)-methyltransferase
MGFAEEFVGLLPEDLPGREGFIAKAAQHLDLIVEANRHFNLTRILDPREAVIKHVADSVIPWRHFAHAGVVADVGSGAGFPGIPLALLLPEVRFVLLESIQKKARFIQSAVDQLELPNVEVQPLRAEEWLVGRRVDLITARAVAPLERAIGLFAPAIRNGSRVLLYKGPDAESEIAESAGEAKKRRIRARIVDRYELPGDMGTRTLVELSA